MLIDSIFIGDPHIQVSNFPEIDLLLERLINLIIINITNLNYFTFFRRDAIKQLIIKFKKFTLFEDGIDKVVNWSKNYYRK